MRGEPQATGKAASQLIDKRIRDLGGWRGDTLARMRKLILEADPEVVEEWKWGTPVWSHDGIICTGEAYKKVVKLTFARGAAVPDPAGLFNSSLEGNTRRAIDIPEGETVDAAAFKALVKTAVAQNGMRRGATSVKTTKTTKATKTSKATKATKATPKTKGKAKPAPKTAVRLLSGGNPQIAKAEGDAPVQAYIAAMPEWKSEIGRRLDALVVRLVPKLTKAVKWNSPMYGVEGRGLFMGFHTFTRYVKVTFFRGTSLKPVPPGGIDKHARWFDIHEDDFDEAQITRWVKQAAALPGWIPGKPL